MKSGIGATNKSRKECSTKIVQDWREAKDKGNKVGICTNSSTTCNLQRWKALVGEYKVNVDASWVQGAEFFL